MPLRRVAARSQASLAWQSFLGPLLGFLWVTRIAVWAPRWVTSVVSSPPVMPLPPCPLLALVGPWGGVPVGLVSLALCLAVISSCRVRRVGQAVRCTAASSPLVACVSLGPC